MEARRQGFGYSVISPSQLSSACFVVEVVELEKAAQVVEIEVEDAVQVAEQLGVVVYFGLGGTPPLGWKLEILG